MCPEKQLDVGKYKDAADTDPSLEELRSPLEDNKNLGITKVH